MTFCQRIVQAAQEQPDKVAMQLLGPNGPETTTYGSMLAQVRSVAYRLGLRGIGLGDRVAIVGENHPNWAIAYLGILYHGAVAVPLDPTASTEALAACVVNSETKLAFVDSISLARFRGIGKQGVPNSQIVVLGDDRTSENEHFSEWAQTATSEAFNAIPPAASPHDLALLIYTSGTTGVPKAVPLTHDNINSESIGLEQALRINANEIILGLLPLFHVYSQMVNLWLAATVGASVIYIAELSSVEITRALKEGKVTALTGVPRLWYLFHGKIFDAIRAQPWFVRGFVRTLMITNSCLRDWFGINLGSLFFRTVHQEFGGRLERAVSGGASFDPEVARDFHRLGFTILQGYGLTETAGAVTVTRFEDNMIGSVGTILNDAEVKIDEPDSEGVGEIIIRGPMVMKAYYCNPEATREAFTADGWFRSGDLGRFDRNGHLYVVGRKKDVIVLPSGKNVFPEDVEAHYARSPLISEITVLGVADHRVGFAEAEKLCAVVVPNFDYIKTNLIANTREAITFELDSLGRELPEYQRVHDYIVRAEPLPRTPMRKVRRFELLAQIKGDSNYGAQTRAEPKLVLTEDDRALMESLEGQALASAVRAHARDLEVIHPQMNLELDLGLDSLARVEVVVGMEEALEINLDSISAIGTLTVGEIIRVAQSEKTATVKESSKSSSLVDQTVKVAAAQSPCWRNILSGPSDDSLNSLFAIKPLTTFMAYVLLRPVYFGARLLLRMEVSGLDHVARLEPPFLVCANHQSFLDPLLVCSIYPRRILKRIFHVGASEYFANFATAQLARLINIVPVDPDLNLLRAMRAGAAGLGAGKILNIYPEGHRSFDGVLHEFKKGAAILATEINVPIVPVALDGVYRVWPRNSWRFRLAKVKVKFGEPINIHEGVAAGVDGEATYEQLTALLKARIQQMLDEMRRK